MGGRGAGGVGLLVVVIGRRGRHGFAVVASHGLCDVGGGGLRVGGVLVED